MGSGKSTVGRMVSEVLNISFVDLDEMIAVYAESSIEEIFREYGEIRFRELEQKCLEKVIEESEFCVIATGGGTPCFYQNMEFMKNNGLVVYLRHSVLSLIRGIDQSATVRPLLSSVDVEQRVSFVEKHLCEREEFYSGADVILETENKTISEIVEEIVEVYSTKNRAGL